MYGSVVTVGATLVIALAVLVLHELGHYLSAVALGVPREDVRMRFDSGPPRVEFAEVEQFSEVSEHLTMRQRNLPNQPAMFFIAGGGHLMELAVATALTASAFIFAFDWVASRFVLLSAFITASYLLVAFISGTFLDEPFGDPVELWRISRAGAMLFYGMFFLVMTGLLSLLPISFETIAVYGLAVSVIFVPLALIAAISK